MTHQDVTHGELDEEPHPGEGGVTRLQECIFERAAVFTGLADDLKLAVKDLLLFGDDAEAGVVSLGLEEELTGLGDESGVDPLQKQSLDLEPPVGIVDCDYAFRVERLQEEADDFHQSLDGGAVVRLVILQFAYDKTGDVGQELLDDHPELGLGEDDVAAPAERVPGGARVDGGARVAPLADEELVEVVEDPLVGLAVGEEPEQACAEAFNHQELIDDTEGGGGVVGDHADHSGEGADVAEDVLWPEVVVVAPCCLLVVCHEQVFLAVLDDECHGADDVLAGFCRQRF